MNPEQNQNLTVPNQPNCEPNQSPPKPSPAAVLEPNSQNNNEIMSDPNLYTDFQAKSSSLSSSTDSDPQISVDQAAEKSKSSPLVMIISFLALLALAYLGYLLILK